MKFCKHCNIQHELTSEYWYRLTGSPECKVYVRLRNRRWKLENTDINYKIACNLRSRLTKVIRLSNSRKVGSSILQLGCTVEELRRYLESKFQAGMTWSNYGDWHIDHIRPLSRFNLSDSIELSQACHYTNLQPMWTTDNIRKGNEWRK